MAVLFQAASVTQPRLHIHSVQAILIAKARHNTKAILMTQVRKVANGKARLTAEIR